MIFTYPRLLNFLGFDEYTGINDKIGSNDKAIFKKTKNESEMAYFLSKDRNSIYSVFKSTIGGDTTSNKFKTFNELINYCQLEFKDEFRQMKIDEILED